jgi:three-Cys-motif partner protein
MTMSSHSKIEWTDATWNPLRGCIKVSPGCKHCYAETFAERFRGVTGHPYEHGFDLRLVPEKLLEPLRWTMPRMVFVNSMSDLFQDGVPDEYIITVARVMVMANWHTFQVLTKRAERMRDMLSDRLNFAAHAHHIWWGVSVEDKRYGMPRIAQLRAAPVEVRFLSIEPLLEGLGQIDLTGIHWVIVGGESGTGARPMQQAWVESIRDQCGAVHVPFFFKQWGGFPKRKRGRVLNGRTYDERPANLSMPIPTPARRRALIEEMEHTVAYWRGIVGKRVSHSEPYRRKETLDVNSDNPLMREKEQYLFPMPERMVPEPKVGRPQYPIWTENKANLIERYLYYFVLITKHGTYIDGFAGPQRPEAIDTWAAKLVLESEPRWLRHFYLFDVGQKQASQLRTLKRSQPERDIHVRKGDFNVLVRDLLSSGDIKQNEATFCLLDQRTFECHWSTLESLAKYKTSGHKIELFYFLPHSWLDRAFAGQKNTKILDKWWGRKDWDEWRDMPPTDRRDAFIKRFKEEFGYWSVKPWPIYQHQEGGNIMYYMVHATDHPAAPDLMLRAYNAAVKPKEPYEQLLLELQSLTH